MGYAVPFQYLSLLIHPHTNPLHFSLPPPPTFPLRSMPLDRLQRGQADRISLAFQVRESRCMRRSAFGEGYARRGRKGGGSRIDSI
jgi:hypothetical protein